MLAGNHAVGGCLIAHSMITLKISSNGQHVCTAGVGEHGALQAILEWVGGNPEADPSDPNRQSIECAMNPVELRVSGVVNSGDEECHYDWASSPLQLGDTITIVVGEGPVCDPPLETRFPAAERQLNSLQNMVRNLCQEWGWQITEPSPSPAVPTVPATALSETDTSGS